jgi:signal transduction histidine kinase
MGELMRVHDWSKTRLGSPEFWPQSLRTSVSTCLNCSFPILIWWGPALVKLYNDAYRPILGAKHPRALGSAGEDVWPEIWHLIGPMLRRVMHQGEAAPAKDLLLPLRRHGYDEECYFSFSYSPIRDESGGVGGVFCPVIETTERVIGERRLHLLRAIAEYLTDLNTPAQACAAAMTCLRESGRHDFPFSAIYLIGDDPATAQLAGCAGFGPDGPACGETLRLDGTLDRTGAATPFAAVVNSSETVMAENPSELLGALPVGPWSTPAERILLIPLGDGGARPAGLMLVGLNPHRPLDEMRGFAELVAAQIAAAVAKARALVEERRRAEALAELDRAKTAFFSNISHEFRTPLTLMLGPLEEIQRKADSAPVSEVRPLAEMAIRNALRLQRLVNTLLDFSRIEAGRLHARYRPTDLARLTAELASSFHSALEQAGLRYIVDCPPLSQPVYVDGDLWEKVVLNLLSNAFKFTLHGEVRVELSEQPGAALLVVRDSGIGIAADQLPHIFDRFHRVEGTRGRSHEGTGIGLALVCDLVRLHGGEVTVASVPDQGSAFSVRIPFGNAHLPADRVSQEAVDVRADALGPAFLEEASSWLADKPGPTGTPGVYAADPRNSLDGAATILLAEDNADMRGYVRRLTFCAARSAARSISRLC